MGVEKREQDGVPIARELLTADGYRWFVFDKETTGTMLVCLEDLETGVIVSTAIDDPDNRSASLRAWMGARQSRSPNAPWQIAAQLVQKDVNVDQKIEDTVTEKGYGHKSGGDMAHLAVEVSHAPLHYFMTMFYLSSVYDGQEKSTRYQSSFGKSSLPDLRLYLPKDIVLETDVYEGLEQKYLAIEQHSRELFLKWKDKLTTVFQKFFKPEEGNKVQADALNARVLDCARKFLLFGCEGGAHFGDWASDISTNVLAQMKGSPHEVYQKFANQIQRLLTPTEQEEEMLGFKAEAPGLIKHANASSVVKDNLKSLNEYLLKNESWKNVSPPKVRLEPQKHRASLIPGNYSYDTRMMCQYVLAANPGLDYLEVMDWIVGQSDVVQEEMSRIVNFKHNNHKLMNNIAQVTGMTFVFESNLAVLRDLNRHRPWGRFMDMMSLILYSKSGFLDVLGRGFTIPRYLTDIKEMSDYSSEYARDMKGLFGSVSEFIGSLYEEYGDKTDLSSVLNLLPLGLDQELFMHGNPMQASYMTNQRVRPGGDIDYTKLAWEASQALSQSSPLMRGVAISSLTNLLSEGMDMSQEPDAADRQRFFNRG